MDQTDLITSDELAAKIKMSIGFIKKHILTRRIPGAVHVGRQWRFNWGEIERRIAIGEFLLPVDGQRPRKTRNMKLIKNAE